MIIDPESQNVCFLHYSSLRFQQSPDQGVFFFVQTMAGYRSEFENPNAAPMFWEIVPGIHWRVSPDCWLSIGASRRSLVTWSWQF